eukprot:SAG31_NODE_453_length_15464_cov_37.074064_13_plen_53_part_00
MYSALQRGAAGGAATEYYFLKLLTALKVLQFPLLTVAEVDLALLTSRILEAR